MRIFLLFFFFITSLEPLDYELLTILNFFFKNLFSLRITSKPEVSMGTQLDGIPTSSPTYWSAKGLTNVENVAYTLRLEVDASGTQVAGMVWCELEKRWDVVGVLSLSTSNKLEISSLRPMVCTFTPKLHKPENHNGNILFAEFTRFQCYNVPRQKRSVGGENDGGGGSSKEYKSKKLKFK